MTELKRILADFHNLTKFKIVLYDTDRNVLYSYPETMCDFCKAVRAKPALAKKCIACDNIGFDICDRTKSPHIYECHMTVTEAIAPIYSGGIHVGYLMFGQILRPSRQNVAEAAKIHGIPVTDEMLRQMPTADDGYIRSAVSMMSVCADYLCTREIIRNNPNVLSYHLEQHIKTHLDGDLSVDALCKRFYLSRAKLYQLSQQAFHMGISDYIRQQRLTKAQKLLVSTDAPVSQIAAQVGIPDTNYFIRAFKQTLKVTPLQYRKSRKG